MKLHDGNRVMVSSGVVGERSLTRDTAEREREIDEVKSWVE